MKTTGRNPVRWPAERILDAIRAWHAEYGYPPSTTDWRRAQTINGFTYPTNTAVTARFSSHAEAVVAAGFRAPSGARWPRERIVVAMREWNATYGAPPRYRDWNAAELRSRGDTAALARLNESPGRWPGSVTVCKVFGTFGAGLSEAGFERAPVWDREEILAAIHRWYRAHGSLPMYNQWQRSSFDTVSGSHTPGAGTVEREFGNFHTAFEAAGFSPETTQFRRHPKRYTDEQLLDAIRAWTNRFAMPPRSRDWTISTLRAENDLLSIRRLETARARGLLVPSCDTVVTRFGSFAEAVRLAGCARPAARLSTPIPSLTRRHVWDRNSIIAAVRAWHAEHGLAPNTKEWRAATLDGPLRHPTERTVVREFGSWRAAMTAADVARPPHERWAAVQIFDAMREWRRRYGDWPTYRAWTPSELKRKGDEEGLRRLLDDRHRWPSPATVRARFGSMRKGVAACIEADRSAPATDHADGSARSDDRVATVVLPELLPDVQPHAPAMRPLAQPEPRWW